MSRIARVLIANRGEIAVRVIRTCRRLGVESVVTVSEADRQSMPARLADRAVCIGPSHPSRSYLDVRAVMAAAKGVGADAVHPGYGFLAENPALAEACAAEGVGFIGPPADAMRLAGNKVRVREVAAQCGVPVLPASGPLASPTAEVERAGEAVGFPLMVKAAAGGGGRGMRVVRNPSSLASAVQTAMAEADAAFGDATVYLERWVGDALHVEVQVAGDEDRLVSLGDRDCSLQRRHQKVVEEAPATRVPDPVRDAMHEYARTFGRATGYRGVGTVEFLFDRTTREAFFLEMNARIQVEHPVTEALTGLDLVELQLRLAEGGDVGSLVAGAAAHGGHAIECRITAEDPARGFRPTPGTLTVWRMPSRPGLRVETHCYESYEVPPFYDSLLAKLIATAPARARAIDELLAGLDEVRIAGISTNVEFLKRILADEAVRSGRHNTTWVETQGSAAAPATELVG